MKNIWIIVIVLVSIIAIIFGYKIINNKEIDERVYNPSVISELDGFAQCLTEKGLRMYGTEWCPHCQNQKELIGSAFQYVDYIDCDENRGLCLAEGVRGYPTWKINDESYPGEQSLERLSSLTGCELN